MMNCRILVATLMALPWLLAAPASLLAQTEDIYVTASGSGTAGSVAFEDEDIVLCDRSGGVGTCQWSMFFDGSANGIPINVDVTAFAVLDENNLLLSFRTPVKIGKLGKVDDSDIIHFNRLAPANDRFTYFFDGSDVGLTTDDERIDALTFDDQGRLMVSTEGNYSVPRTGGGALNGTDADLIVLSGTLNGDKTTGTWAMYFDGSVAGLNTPQEDIWGSWIDQNTDEVYITTRGDYSIGGLSGTGTDIFVCDPANQGPITSCSSVYLFFRAAQESYSDRIIDGMFIFNFRNSPPLALDDAFSTNEDTPLGDNVLGNDSDPNGDVLAVSQVNGSAANVGVQITLVSGATVTQNSNGSFTYDPNGAFESLAPGESAPDSYGYSITDGNGGSDSATVDITITGVDDPPVAVNDSATVTENDPATGIDVLANDTDVDGGPMLVEMVSAPTNGAVIIIGGGAGLSYEPDADYCNDGTPTDDFTYTLNGGSIATVSVTVICLPDPPVVTAPGPFGVIGNVGISVPDGASDLLSNVTGTGPITLNSYDATSANGGTVSVNTATGAFTYNPPAGFETADTFNYSVCGAGGCTPATVTLNVAGMIWFVDASAAGGGDGRLSAPFNCLNGAGCYFPGAADEAGDNIFLADGAYIGGVTLLNNQRLIGDGSSTTLAMATGITVPSFSNTLPVFSGTDPTITSAANGVNLGSGNTVRGLTIGDVVGTALSGTAAGNLAISEVTVGDATPSGGAIEVSTSGALSVSFDNLSATSSTDEGIRLIGVSGSFAVVGTGGSIQTTNVPAIVIDGNASLALAMTFSRVSANGGANGIVLTDTTGTFSVTGSGTPGSGGTIQNMAGANGTTAGIGISLSNVQNVSLGRMQLNGHQNFAISGAGVNGFNLTDSVVNGVNGNSVADGEGSIRFTNLTGTANFNGSTVAGGLLDNIRVENSAGNLTMNVIDSMANPMIIGLNDTTFGNDGIQFVTTGTAMATLTLDGVEFLGARGDMVQTLALDTSIQNITIKTSTFLNAHTNVIAGGITLSGGSNTGNIQVGYEVSNNTFSGAKGNAITANFVSGAGTINGQIKNNMIGTATAGSGSSQGSGILAAAEKNGNGPGLITHTVLIDANVIQGVSGYAGIDILSNRGANVADTAVLNAIVINNLVAGLSGFAFTGVSLLAGGSGPGDFAGLCADIRNNTVNASGAATGQNAVLFDQISSNARYNLPAYAGSPNGELAAGTASADINGYLGGRGNTLTNGGFPSFPAFGVNAGGVLGVTGIGTTCP